LYNQLSKFNLQWDFPPTQGHNQHNIHM
jgi:hypothetical protein